MTFDEAYAILQEENFTMDLSLDALDILFGDSVTLKMTEAEIYEKLTNANIMSDDAGDISELLCYESSKEGKKK